MLRCPFAGVFHAGELPWMVGLFQWVPLVVVAGPAWINIRYRPNGNSVRRCTGQAATIIDPAVTQRRLAITSTCPHNPSWTQCGTNKLALHFPSQGATTTARRPCLFEQSPPKRNKSTLPSANPFTKSVKQKSICPLLNSKRVCYSHHFHLCLNDHTIATHRLILTRRTK